MADILKSLANPCRLAIAYQLLDGEHPAGELGQNMHMTQSSLSQHLGRLRRDKIVTTRRDSRTIFYRLADPCAVDVVQSLYAVYTAHHDTKPSKGRK